jgi:hypothetical protein
VFTKRREPCKRRLGKRGTSWCRKPYDKTTTYVNAYIPYDDTRLRTHDVNNRIDIAIDIAIVYDPYSDG